MLKLPSDGDYLRFDNVEYFIPADWVGKHDIVSKCGWWIGEVCIVVIDGERYIDWLQTCSLNIDED